MTTIESFREFYKTQIAPQLQAMHEQRKAVNNKYSFKKYGKNVLFLFLMLLLMGVLTMFNINPPKAFALILMITFFFYTVITPFVFIIKRNANLVKLETKYKNEIIPRILNALYPDLKYQLGSGLLSNECKIQTFLLNESSLGFTSEDLICGSVNGHEFKMSDVTFTYRPIRRNEVSKITSVRGAYAIFRSPVSFPFSFNVYQPNSALQVIKDVVDPIIDTIKKIPEPIVNVVNNRIGRIVERESFKNKIKVGDTEFDRIFHVISDNEEAAKGILTMEVMDKIKKIINSNSFSLNIGLYGNEIHFAFPYFNLFEFSLGAFSTDEQDERLTYQYIIVIGSMIDLYEHIKNNAVKINNQIT
jgi:hypothetical protein